MRVRSLSDAVHGSAIGECWEDEQDADQAEKKRIPNRIIKRIMNESLQARERVSHSMSWHMWGSGCGRRPSWSRNGRLTGGLLLQSAYEHDHWNFLSFLAESTEKLSCCSSRRRQLDRCRRWTALSGRAPDKRLSSALVMGLHKLDGRWRSRPARLRSRIPHSFIQHQPKRLAARAAGNCTRNFQDGGRVYFTSGGSEATETAIKLARQYFLETEAAERDIELFRAGRAITAAHLARCRSVEISLGGHRMRR